MAILSKNFGIRSSKWDKTWVKIMLVISTSCKHDANLFSSSVELILRSGSFDAISTGDKINGGMVWRLK